jgi:hypothetical protein
MEVTCTLKTLCGSVRQIRTPEFQPEIRVCIQEPLPVMRAGSLVIDDVEPVPIKVRRFSVYQVNHRDYWTGAPTSVTYQEVYE